MFFCFSYNWLKTYLFPNFETCQEDIICRKFCLQNMTLFDHFSAFHDMTWRGSWVHQREWEFKDGYIHSHGYCKKKGFKDWIWMRMLLRFQGCEGPPTTSPSHKHRQVKRRRKKFFSQQWCKFYSYMNI